MDLIKLAHDLHEESLIYKNEYTVLFLEFKKLAIEAPRGELIADDCLMNQTLEELQLMYRNTLYALNNCIDVVNILGNLIESHDQLIDMLKKNATVKTIPIKEKNGNNSRNNNTDREVN